MARRLEGLVGELRLWARVTTAAATAADHRQLRTRDAALESRRAVTDGQARVEQSRFHVDEAVRRTEATGHAVAATQAAADDAGRRAGDTAAQAHHLRTGIDRDLDAARRALHHAQEQLRVAVDAYHHAQASLTQAQSRLASAQAALSACLSQRVGDPPRPPPCTAERAAVANAQQEVSHWTQEVGRCQALVQQWQTEVDRFQTRVRVLEDASRLAGQAEDAAREAEAHAQTAARHADVGRDWHAAGVAAVDAAGGHLAAEQAATDEADAHAAAGADCTDRGAHQLRAGTSAHQSGLEVARSADRDVSERVAFLRRSDELGL